MSGDARTTISYEPEAEGLTEMVDLLVLVAQADGEIDDKEAESLNVLLNTLRRDVLNKNLNAAIIRQSLFRIKREGARAAVERVGKRLGRLGKIEDGLGLGHDVAETGHTMTELEWTILVMVGRAAGLAAERIREIIGPKPER